MASWEDPLLQGNGDEHKVQFLTDYNPLTNGMSNGPNSASDSSNARSNSGTHRYFNLLFADCSLCKLNWTQA